MRHYCHDCYYSTSYLGHTIRKVDKAGNIYHDVTGDGYRCALGIRTSRVALEKKCGRRNTTKRWRSWGDESVDTGSERRPRVARDYRDYWIVIPKSERRKVFMVEAKNELDVWPAIREHVGEAHIERIIHLQDVVEATELIEKFKDFVKSLGFKRLKELT